MNERIIKSLQRIRDDAELVLQEELDPYVDSQLCEMVERTVDGLDDAIIKAKIEMREIEKHARLRSMLTEALT